MRNSKVNLADVARVVGVSTATVDRVINQRGGVRPDKEERILQAARALGLDRALSHRPARALRIGVLLQPQRNAFHAALREGFQQLSQLQSGLNLQLYHQQLDPQDPAEAAQKITALIGLREALVVALPEVPQIARALRHFAASGPVVTLSNDIAGAGRSLHIGPDDGKGGRLAGDLMGALLGAEGGDVVMLAENAADSGARARAAGFRAILAERHPHVRLRAVLDCGEDSGQILRMIGRTVQRDAALRGIYHSAGGLSAVCDGLMQAGRADTTVVIAHELSEVSRQLLVTRRIQAVLDQKPALAARLALEEAARLLGRLEGVPQSHVIAQQIFLPESF